VASGNSPNWHTFRREFNLPPGCVKIEVVVRTISAIGSFDFDEVAWNLYELAATSFSQTFLRPN
jgi:hypothetical protein